MRCLTCQYIFNVTTVAQRNFPSYQGCTIHPIMLIPLRCVGVYAKGLLGWVGPTHRARALNIVCGAIHLQQMTPFRETETPDLILRLCRQSWTMPCSRPRWLKADAGGTHLFAAAQPSAPPWGAAVWHRWLQQVDTGPLVEVMKPTLRSATILTVPWKTATAMTNNQPLVAHSSVHTCGKARSRSGIWGGARGRGRTGARVVWRDAGGRDDSGLSGPGPDGGTPDRTRRRRGDASRGRPGSMLTTPTRSLCRPL